MPIKGTTKSTESGRGWQPTTSKTEPVNYDNLGDGWIFIISFMRWYPDFLLDLLRSEDADYSLTLIQRIVIRAKARHQYCDITGCRGMTKSYCSIIEEMSEMNFYPRIRVAYFAPSYKQGAKIASQIYKQICKDYPIFAEHFAVIADSTDRFELETVTTHSNLAITAFRGNTVAKVVAEETAQENPPRFDENDYKTVVLPAIRQLYMVKGRKDPVYIAFKQHTITSAGRRQNFSYETRTRHYVMMARGESAFVIDIPFDVPLLCQMRPVSWAESLRTELTPDEWAREMESRYTGGEQNSLIPENTLSECRCLMTMEEHHCCKDHSNKLSPGDVFYVVAYDVSYADGAANAKCATVVIKCTVQDDFFKRDKYLKQVVWVDDSPPKPAMEQAERLKQIWYRYCFEGHHAYIALDAWQYGSSVLQALMMDLKDGLPPLCTFNHTTYTEYELEDSLPVVYPIKAGGVGTTDPDAEMIRYAEVQFDNHNVELLTANYHDGMDAYKNLHRIKDDKYDYAIYNPYKKTNELAGQIQNLKKIMTAGGVAERRISMKIQRDSWSALKYGLRLCQILERTYLVKKQYSSDWENLLAQYEGKDDKLSPYPAANGSGGKTRLPFERKGRGYYGKE